MSNVPNYAQAKSFGQAKKHASPANRKADRANES